MTGSPMTTTILCRMIKPAARKAGIALDELEESEDISRNLAQGRRSRSEGWQAQMRRSLGGRSSSFPTKSEVLGEHRSAEVSWDQFGTKTGGLKAVS
jgi:hypothetical protein